MILYLKWFRGKQIVNIAKSLIYRREHKASPPEQVRHDLYVYFEVMFMNQLDQLGIVAVHIHYGNRLMLAPRRGQLYRRIYSRSKSAPQAFSSY